jgi:hypothetical protein
MAMRRWDPINERQRAALERIAAGEDLSGDSNIAARVSAGALRNRGLVTIHKRAGHWDGEITDAGTFYLAHGHHPDDPRHQPTAPTTPTKPTKPTKPERSGKVAVASRRPPRTTEVITDQRRLAAEALVQQLTTRPVVVVDLTAATDEAYWRRVVDFTKRHKMHPDGARIEKLLLPHSDKLQIRLLDGVHANSRTAPATQPPVPVPQTLRSLHPVVADLKGDTRRLDMPADLRRRALIIFQALCNELVRRGHTVHRRAVEDTNAHGYHHGSRYPRREGQIEVVIGENRYVVDIRQESPQSADPKKASRLLLELPAYRSGGRRYKWADRERARIEHGLADICDELQTRAGEDDQRRADEARTAAQRQIDWAAAMETAHAKAIEAHRTGIVLDELKRWTLAADVRRYCDAMQQSLDATKPGDPDVVRAATEWIAWARARAVAMDPLSTIPRMPADPDLGPADLEPYLGKWSPYGPDSDYRGRRWT